MTPKSFKTLVFFGLFLVSLMTVSCSSPGGSDPYSKVASVCMTQDPLMGTYLGLTPQALIDTYLSSDCKAALESVIPYDNNSFATAPTGMKDKVTEAMQAIIAYPLAVDPNDTKFLGTQPQLAGAIPLFFVDIYQEAANPNQALFNYILNHTDVIQYGGPNSDIDAMYVPAFSTHVRQITIYSGFWDMTNSIEGYRDAFIRASTLAHEARHGDSIVHADCVTSMTNGSGFECDNELDGAYGFAATYLKYLIHGGATCSTPGCTPALPPLSVELAGWYMCVVARDRLNNRYPELDALVGNPALAQPADLCGNLVTYDWVMQQEGIPLPPTLPSSAGAAVAVRDQSRPLSTIATGHAPLCNYH